ncbi:Uncharacterised protein [Streptococcus pneumoniae]|nr:Uncharacterised protein [Streptococcus pneumoniae]
MAAGLGIGLIQPLGIFIVTEQLGLSKESLQWLLTVNGAGMIVGGALAMVFAKNVAPQKMLIIGMLGQARDGFTFYNWIIVYFTYIQFKASNSGRK